jgi:hypothetical protein
LRRAAAKKRDVTLTPFGKMSSSRKVDRMMKIVLTLALAMMTFAATAAVKKAEVKKSAQQQKAEAARAELRSKAKESPKPKAKAAEEPANSQQPTGKFFSSMSQGETARIESGSAHIVQITGTNATTIVFAWARNATQRAVFAGVNLVGLYHDDMDIKMPYALIVDGTQTVKTPQGVSVALPVLRPATKAEAEKRGFADYEIRPTEN